MTELLTNLKEQEQVENLCKKNSLNIDLLSDFFMLSAKGLNNKELAQKLGVHRVTVQRYAAAMRKLSEENWLLLYNFVIQRGQDEDDDSN